MSDCMIAVSGTVGSFVFILNVKDFFLVVEGFILTVEIFIQIVESWVLGHIV